MHTETSSLTVLLAFAAPLFASPVPFPDLEVRELDECAIINGIVEGLQAVTKVAYPFCSSYLKIPVVTSTTTMIRLAHILAEFILT